MNGFVRTDASFQAHVNLVVQVAMCVALIAGGLLARTKRYTALHGTHAMCGMRGLPDLEKPASTGGRGNFRKRLRLPSG
jgi:hypothetical protein